MQMHKEGYRNLRIGNDIFIPFIEECYSKHQISSYINNFRKIFQKY